MTLMPHWPIFTGEVKSINNINVLRVLGLLDNPQEKMKNIIHISGTNGKGSTASFLHQILLEHGFSANKYTSPHLLACNERILNNKNQISDDELYFYIEQVRHTCEDSNIELTIFEATTIAAFLFFAKTNANFNVIEVGMGGLNDATNVFDDEQVLCAILTPVSLDHTKFLGDNLIDITTQKIAIAKHKYPLVCGPQNFEVANFIYQFCQNNAIPLTIYAKDFETIQIQNENNEIDNENFCLTYSYQDDSGEIKQNDLILPTPSLKGHHQLINASTAIMAMLCIESFEINYDKLCLALKNTKWQGRLEQITQKHLLQLLPQNSIIYFDGAHNQGGAKVLANFIKSFDVSLNNYIIIARSKETDSAIFANELINANICSIFATRCHGEVKPEHENTIYKQIVNSPYSTFFNEQNTFACKNLNECLSLINQKNKNQPCRVFICGSLYMARDIFVLSKNWQL